MESPSGISLAGVQRRSRIALAHDANMPKDVMKSNMTTTLIPAEPDTRKRAARFLLLFVFASVLVGFLFDQLFGQFVFLRPEHIGNWLDNLGPWAPFAYMTAMIVAVVLSPIPSVPLDIASGLAFGWFWGTIYTLIGAEIGAIIAFLIARRLGRPWLNRKLPTATMAKIDELAERQGFRALVIMRVLPVFNFDWVSYAAGLTSVSLPVFALATFIGMIPPVVGIVAVGATLSDNPALSGAIFSGLVVLAIGPLLVPWLPSLRRRRMTE